MIRLLYILILFIPISIEAGKKSDLPLPRFASIKSNEVNARTGPSIKSPIEWVFVKKNEPVEIIAEYEQWRQIRDVKNDTGWVHSSVLSGKRSVIIIGQESKTITKKPVEKSKIIANIHPNVRCELKKCESDYCKIKCFSPENKKYYSGFIQKKDIWGVYKNE